MNRQIYEEAAGWLLEFRTEDVDAAARHRFEQWLCVSPQHVQAYLELASVWEVASAGDPGDVEQAGALIERARHSGNVVSLDASVANLRSNERDAGPHSRNRPFLTAIVGAAACALLAIVVAGGWLYTQRNTYATAVGEQRSILLPDGSTIELNARSSVRVRYTEVRRDVELLSGQALFQVAKDRARPFIVTSNQMRVRAVGTRFDVNQRRRATIVSVVEGTVSVSVASARADADSSPSLERSHPEPGSARTSPEGASAPASPGAVLVTAGEQTTLTPGAPLTPKHADVVTAIAWTDRRLIFENTSLADVAEEFNRYNRLPLIIQGDGLEDFHVSGGFPSSDPEPLLHFLRAQDGIHVAERSDAIIVSRKR